MKDQEKIKSLESIPYAKPFAQLGKIRSAGITDLRYGNLVDEDWQGSDRFEQQADQREMIPLPKSIDFYSIAGVIGQAAEHLPDMFQGDTLVHVKSALGKHDDADKDLKFLKKNTWIAKETSHLDLLSSGRVYEKIKRWLGE